MEDGRVDTKRDPTVGSSADRPAPVGTTVKTKIERGDRYSAPEVYNLEITVLETVRGEAARVRVWEEGVATDPPAGGLEYLLARVRFGYFSKGRGFSHEKEPYRIGADHFVAFSADATTEYEIPSLVRQPQPQLIDAPFSTGDVREGWIVLMVPEREEEPLLIFKREYRENTYGMWGPMWFRL